MTGSDSAAAFSPISHTNEYFREFTRLTHTGTEGGFYIAELHLPQGVEVTKLGFYWWDNSSTDYLWFMMYVKLLGESEYSDFLEMYSGDTGIGYTAINVPDITSIIIDNNQYTYCLYLYFSGNTLNFYGAFVEYAYLT